MADEMKPIERRRLGMCQGYFVRWCHGLWHMCRFIVGSDEAARHQDLNVYSGSPERLTAIACTCGKVFWMEGA